jgi:glycosyltransferase involved in cell wall biosynthesis
LKIVINTAHQRFGGAVQVALSFIYECIHFSENEYHVWVGQGVAKSLDTKLFPKNFHFYFFDFGEINLKSIRNIQNTLAPIENKIKPNIIIATTGPSYFKSVAPQIIGFNLPLYIYPESPFLKEINWKRKVFSWIMKKVHYFYFKRDAIAYVVQTEDVALRVKKALKTDKVYTVTNTASNYYKSWKKYENKLPQKEQGVFRFLCISSYYPHKNLELINEVVDVLEGLGHANIEFVLTLKYPDFKAKFKQSTKIINAGPIPPEACPSLYNECDALFLPTLAECFSASYPEAMIMEKPIITTNLGFAKSICGNAALYFKPKDALSAAQAIIVLAEDEKLQKKLIEQGKNQLKEFDSPKERARKFLDLCYFYKK